MGKAMSQEEIDLAPQLWDETMKEVDLGFLVGPFESEAAVTEHLGVADWSMSQRFLLLQGEEQKPRVIDNYRDSGVLLVRRPTFRCMTRISYHAC